MESVWARAAETTPMSANCDFAPRCVASRIDRDRSRSPVWEIIRSRAAGAAVRSALLRAVISFTRSVAFFRLSSSSWAVMFTFAIPSSMLMAFFTPRPRPAAATVAGLMKPPKPPVRSAKKRFIFPPRPTLSSRSICRVRLSISRLYWRIWAMFRGSMISFSARSRSSR